MRIQDCCNILFCFQCSCSLGSRRLRSKAESHWLSTWNLRLLILCKREFFLLLNYLIQYRFNKSDFEFDFISKRRKPGFPDTQHGPKTFILIIREKTSILHIAHTVYYITIINRRFGLLGLKGSLYCPHSSRSR